MEQGCRGNARLVEKLSPEALRFSRKQPEIIVSCRKFFKKSEKNDKKGLIFSEMPFIMPSLNVDFVGKSGRKPLFPFCKGV